MPGIESMTWEELRDAYYTMERRYESLGEALKRAEADKTSLTAKNAILEAQKIQWESAKDIQSGMIQQHLGDKDAEMQEMAEVIVTLRARLRVAEED